MSQLPELLTGQFRDGPLVGLDYQTASQRGVTDEEGKFIYRAGEVVTFSIGRLTIGCVAGASSLTLADLDDTEDGGRRRTAGVTHPATVNRARFVQSLGQGGYDDLRNGVVVDSRIREVVSTHADGISFSHDVDDFEQATGVQAVLRKLDRRLRGAAQARNHVRRAQQGIRALRDVRIPMRDGSSYLDADVFHPVDAAWGPGGQGCRYPVLLRLSVYGRAFTIGSRLGQADADASEEREAAWFEQPEKRNKINPYFRYSESCVSANASTWVPRGYIVIRVDGRGVGRTPGKLDPFSRQEALDFYDAVQWAAQQP
jgi:hypothetical protein